jgi:peptidoglycan-N-acetylglucosamine deacetylase
MQKKPLTRALTGQAPLISVIIPAFNEEAEIKTCLDSLLKQDLDSKFFEVIVIDNASTDETAKIIKKYPFRYIFEPKKSVVIARQKGVEVSRGKILVSADADTKYPKDWLAKIKNDFDKDPDLLGVVGWIYYRGTSPAFNIANGLSQQANLFISRYSKRFPLVFAANFAFKKTALTKIGGYPRHLPELGDQQYILRRFFKLGKVIVDPKVKCFTSNRQLKNPGKNIFIYNGWYRLIGYPLNFIFEKEVVGPKPAVRRAVIQARRSHS